VQPPVLLRRERRKALQARMLRQVSPHPMRIRPLIPLVLVAATAATTAHAAGPSVGECLSATEAALKLRNDHKLREARHQLLICAAPSCPSDVRADCTHGVEETNA